MTKKNEIGYVAADVIVSHFDSSLAAVRTAEKNGALSVGVHADLREIAPAGWLTGVSWNWGPLYAKLVTSVLDHSWKPINQRYGVKDGYVKLSSFGSHVPKKVQDEALKAMDQLKRGQLVVFAGPLKDRDDKERVAPGKRLEGAALESINWLVAGIEGSITSK